MIKKTLCVIVTMLKENIDYIVNNILLSVKKIEVGNNVKIFGILKIYGGSGRIVIGNDVTLRADNFTNQLGGVSNKLIFRVGPNGSIFIGNCVGITRSCIVSCNKVVIEDNVLIGGDCKIYDTDFHPIDYEQRINNENSCIKSLPIHIKKGAWIGAHSIILKGVTIGEHSIVGAGSVVTKDIPNDEIWAGNPARFIRKLK